MKKTITILGMLWLAISAMAATTEVISIATDNVPGAPVDVTVIVPEGYEPGMRFPTVYLLNGYDGNHRQWPVTTQPRLAELADEYAMVMVMPDGRDSWYWDSPAMPEMKMETFIIEDLVPYIDNSYPTLPTREKRAITGLSMGGQGALWLAMRHPDVFGSAGSTSGGVDIRKFPKNWKMPQWLGSMAEHPENWEQHSIMNLIPSLEPGRINIIFDCGADDFFAEVNANLHHALLDAKIPHDYISRPGKHSHTYWRNSILYQLLYFDQVFSQE